MGQLFGDPKVLQGPSFGQFLSISQEEQYLLGIRWLVRSKSGEFLQENKLFFHSMKSGVIETITVTEKILIYQETIYWV